MNRIRTTFSALTSTFLRGSGIQRITGRSLTYLVVFSVVVMMLISGTGVFADHLLVSSALLAAPPVPTVVPAPATPSSDATFRNSITLEFIKTGLNGGVAALTAVLGLIVGHRITAQWNTRQKRREIQLTTATQFYQLYGEFFAIWKLWNYAKGRHKVRGDVVAADPESRAEDFVKIRWALLERTCTAEGNVEAILVKLASERVLDEGDIETLGKFRQAYQTLRETIRDDMSLDWYASVPETPEYVAFKDLATRVSSMLDLDEPARPEPDKASEALRKVTAQHWKETWMNR